jgi:glucan 1,3-beta-glucosidase
MSSSQMDDWNPESAILPPPRFLGTLDSQGARDSLVTTSTAPHSDGVSSVYALNNNNHESYSSRGSPRTASAPLVSPFGDVPRSPGHDAYDPTVPLSTTPSPPPPRFLSDKEAAYAAPKSRRKRIFILAAIVAVIIIAAAVAVPLATRKHHSNNSDAVSPGSQSSSTAAAKPTSSSSPNKAIVTGGDGTVITMEDGTKFTYGNKFGGVWYWDPNDPFNDSAYPQSWTPALNKAFNWGVDHVRG